MVKRERKKSRANSFSRVSVRISLWVSSIRNFRNWNPTFLASFQPLGVRTGGFILKLGGRATKFLCFYGLPKVHKPGYPFGPIVSFIDSPTYMLSKHLAQILRPLMGNTDLTVNNSVEFCEQWSTVKGNKARNSSIGGEWLPKALRDWC